LGAETIIARLFVLFVSDEGLFFKFGIELL
jgi:hypothetical protein